MLSHLKNCVRVLGHSSPQLCPHLNCGYPAEKMKDNIKMIIYSYNKNYYWKLFIFCVNICALKIYWYLDKMLLEIFCEMQLLLFNFIHSDSCLVYIIAELLLTSFHWHCYHSIKLIFYLNWSKICLFKTCFIAKEDYPYMNSNNKPTEVC